jgi:hypothetical protein
MTCSAVTRRTANGVRDLYARLSLTAPDTGMPNLPRAAAEVRAQARSAGWSPPLAWDDIDTDPTASTSPDPAFEVDDIDIDIERILRGQPISLTVAERDLLIDRLTQRGYSLHQLSRYLDSPAGRSRVAVPRSRLHDRRRARCQVSV